MIQRESSIMVTMLIVMAMFSFLYFYLVMAVVVISGMISKYFSDDPRFSVPMVSAIAAMVMSFSDSDKAVTIPKVIMTIMSAYMIR